MTEEFNLSKKQDTLIIKITDAVVKKKYDKVGLLLGQIIINEKEFIKRLKEKFKGWGEENFFIINKTIDKLVGEKLTK